MDLCATFFFSIWFNFMVKGKRGRETATICPLCSLFEFPSRLTRDCARDRPCSLEVNTRCCCCAFSRTISSSRRFFPGGKEGGEGMKEIAMFNESSGKGLFNDLRRQGSGIPAKIQKSFRISFFPPFCFVLLSSRCYWSHRPWTLKNRKAVVAFRCPWLSSRSLCVTPLTECSLFEVPRHSDISPAYGGEICACGFPETTGGHPSYA